MNFNCKNDMSLKYESVTENLNNYIKNKTFKFSVIVPVYNNGEIFISKCLKSLKKSEMFKEIEIIVVDDGSNNKNTLDILEDIQKTHENISVFLCKDGNSKSPSTPRNIGFKMCSCDYITYLDPDNESVNEGYKKLYETISNGKYDVVIGNIVIKKDDKKAIRNYYDNFKRINNGNDESYDGKDILLKTNFMSQSIQATMIKKTFIEKVNIKMVDKALGEDTLFFYELMLNTKSVKVINEIIHIYNKDDPSSLTNNINKEFFEKYLILEKHKINILKKHDVLDNYLDLKYEMYFKNWYLAKLKNVDIKEKEACSKILNDIYHLYSDYWILKSNTLKNYFSNYCFKNFNEFKFTIIIAIYNNGEYLKNRCIESLRKSIMFDDIEILLIDDGSDDKDTIKVIRELQSKYKNIKTYFFKQGGSGSASRPRNKGIELATTDYITYLDPDNEAVENGYEILYNNIKNSEADLVIGNIMFVNNENQSINNYYNVFLRGNYDSNLTNNKNILLKTKFMAQSIQALLVKKSIIIDNNLNMVNGAIGEDTLFFYQLLVYCKNINVVKDIIHKYYKNRDNSVTNSIDITYFEKHLLIEKEKKIFLEKQGLIDGYLKYKQSYNFKVWILDKLKYCKKSDYLKAQDTVDKIYEIYKDIWIVEDKKILNYILRRESYLNKTKKL